MEKIKVESKDVTTILQCIFINGVLLTPENIEKYDLHKVKWKCNKEQNVYRINKTDKKHYIVHYKNTNTIDWCDIL